jgi:hypothetical protein
MFGMPTDTSSMDEQQKRFFNLQRALELQQIEKEYSSRVAG